MGKKKGLFSSVKRCFTSKKKRTDKKRSNKGKKRKGNWGHGETKSFVPFFRPPSSIEKILGEADQLNIQPGVSLKSLQVVEKAGSPNSVSPRASSPKVVSSIKRDPYPTHTLREAFSADSNGGQPSSDGPNGEVDTSHFKKPLPTLPPGACSQNDLYPGHTLHEAFHADSSNVGDPSVNETEFKVETTQLKKPALDVPLKTCYQSDLYPEPVLDEPFPASSSNGGDFCSLGREGKVETSYVKRLLLTAGDKNTSVLKIQAAYRGYLARRNFRALKRLQTVLRCQNVKRQTMNTMKQTQFLVRVQTRARSQRIKMPALHRPELPQDKGIESRRSLNQLPLGCLQGEEWDTSMLSKEEEDARLQKKVEAVMKRERAMAYAYSHQQWNSNTRSSRGHPDLRFNGYPWCWNWFDRYLAAADTSYSKTTVKSTTSTPRKPSSEHKMSPQSYPRCNKHRRGYDTPLKDDESLMSCPAFNSPRYMSPTVSAMAKVQPNDHRNGRFPGTPDSDWRFSFPLTPNHDSFKDSASQTGRHMESPRSTRSSAMNSRLSTSPLGGRKPFNRF